MIYIDSDHLQPYGFIAQLRSSQYSLHTTTIKTGANKSDLVIYALISLTFPFENCWEAVDISF